MRKIIIIAFLIRLLFIFGSYHPDLGNHTDWGNKFWEYGSKNFYSAGIWKVSWPNQPPGTMYMWAVIGKINSSIQGVLWYFNTKIPLFPSMLIPFFQNNLHNALVKFPSVITDLGIGYLIYLFIRYFKEVKKWQKILKPEIAAMLFLFNPLVIYNSSIWGQTDSIINFLFLLAIYLYLVKNKLFLSIFFIFLSFYIKASLLIFVPLFALMIFNREKNKKKIIVSIIFNLFIFSLISIPFCRRNVFMWVFFLYKDRILGGQGNMLTGNAFNLWTIIFGIDFSKTDIGYFWGISYKLWGISLFLINYLYIIWNFIKKRSKEFNLMFYYALLAFSSFMFLTNMHERYLYPLFPYLTILTGLGLSSLYLYFGISLLHLINLFNLWFYPTIPFLRSLLENRQLMLPKILSGILLLLYILFFLKTEKFASKEYNKSR